MAKKSKRRYADGGNVPAASSSPTSAFSQSQVQPTPSNMFSTPNYQGGNAGNDGNAGTPPVVINLGGGAQPTFKKGGKVSSASKRADGCARRGKTRA